MKNFTLTCFFLLTLVYGKAQPSSVFADFENGTTLPFTYTWDDSANNPNDTCRIATIDNPSPDEVNASLKVMDFEFWGVWGGAATPWDMGTEWYEGVQEIQMDVYIPDVENGRVDVQFHNPVEGDPMTVNGTAIQANKWVTVSYDLNSILQGNFRTITLYLTGCKKAYIDNVVFIKEPNENPITSLSILDDGAGGISENNGYIPLSFEISPSDPTYPLTSWHIKEGIEHAMINRDGTLVAVSDGEVTVELRANDGSGVSAEKTYTISNQLVIDGSRQNVGTLNDENGERIRGTFTVVGKDINIRDAVDFGSEIGTLDEMKSRSLNTVRLCWVDPWYEVEGYDFWSINQALSYIDEAVANASIRGMNIIINYHSVGEFLNTYLDPNLKMERVREFWDVIAPRYKDNELVYYEILNEPIFGDGSKYLSEPFKNELIGVYQDVRAMAPMRQILLFSFANCDASFEPVIEAYKDSIDWDYTTIAYHLYATPTTETVQKWMENYRVICTEWDYPGNAYYIVDVDGYELNVRALEDIGSAWIDWRTKGWGDVDFDELDEILIPDAIENDYWWGSSVSTNQISTSELKIFPNPTMGRVNITSLNMKVKSYKVYNMNGLLLGVKPSVNSLEFSVDVSPLPEGVYILNVNYADNSHENFKLIRQ